MSQADLSLGTTPIWPSFVLSLPFRRMLNRAGVRIMSAKIIFKHVWAALLSFIVWFGIAFICLLVFIFVPEYPTQSMWPLWVSGILAVPAAIYAWRVVLRK